MSIGVARRKRIALYLSICGLLLMAVAISAVSTRDPSGAWLRVGIIMMTIGAALWLPWPAVFPTALLFWLGSNALRATIDDLQLFDTNLLLELPGIIGLALFATLTRHGLRTLEEEDLMIGVYSDMLAGIDPTTGAYEERLLRPAVEAELLRSQRFGREFALALVGVDELHRRLDYRDDEAWQAAFVATSNLLRSTRVHVDRLYLNGTAGFALLLPESGPREVRGLIRRLRRATRQTKPGEGEVGGPLPTHFGATFFPQSATTVDDLLRRAEIALRLGQKNLNRMQLDTAEAPALPPPDRLRQAEAVVEAPADDAGEQEEQVTVHLPESGSSTAASVSQEPAESPAAESLPIEAPAIPAIPQNGVTPKTEAPAAPAEYPLIEAFEETQTLEDQPAVASEEPAGSREPAAIAAAEPSPAQTALGELPAAEAEPLDDAVSDLLHHLDETLDLIRSLKSAPPA